MRTKEQQRQCQKLIAAPTPHFLVLLWDRRVKREAESEKKGE